MNKLAIKFLNFYKRAISPNTSTCKFYPSCSTYSKEAYTRFNFFKASWLTFYRLLRCFNPFYKGRVDHVPEKNN